MADVVNCVCILVGLFCFIATYNFGLALTATQAAQQQHPASDFSRHTLVKPRIYHGREKRQISTTKEEDGGGGHTHHVTLELDVEGTEHILDLKLNRDLLPKGYFVRHQNNGSHVVNRPNENEVELCHYHGKIRGIPESWAAVSTCRKGLNGVIYDGKEMHYIEKASNEPHVGVEDLHYLYKHSDLVENNKTCGYEGDAYPLHHKHDHHEHEYNRILRYKRAIEPEIRGPYNSNKQSRYVELVLVVDNNEYKQLGENKHEAEQHCKDIANIINGLYAPLNIFIALVGVVMWTDYNEVDLTSNGDTTLTNFLHYRREKLIKEHPNDNAQLLTKMNFDNGVVGKALKGPMCTYSYSGGVNTDHSPVVGLVATTVAHEMGHNFGMEHDTNECKCPEDRCIMAPSSSTAPPTHWSSCSLEYLALAFTHGMDYCLRNKPLRLFNSPFCGNGFVENGEQCDCGLAEHCDNPCCNATTCMLHSNASCATGECCDFTTCKPKSAGTVCRAADYECDLPEYCTGQSEYCPEDVYKLNAQSCDEGRAYCYNGFCRTKTDQCRLLWGSTGKTSDEQCYRMNVKGTRHGNCGYNRSNETYIKCEDDNILCGMLHCTHLNEKLEFGMESVSILSHSFINLKGSIIPCRTAIVDLGLSQVDPGLAPDGSKCGDGKMCVNQKCMAVDSLRKQIGFCPNNCNGNGICNSLGHCHCNDGFAPPFCDYPGVGGSQDSGPASDPNAHKDVVTAMLIFFLGVIPGIALIALFIFYTKHNVSPIWKKGPASSKSPPKPRGNNSFQPDAAKRGEDNHSLLAEDGQNPAVHNEFFGHFKGFTLTPIKTATSPKSEPEAPVRPAPPVPIVPTAPAIVPVSPSAPTLPMKSPTVNRATSNVTAKVSLFNKPSVNKAQSFKQNSLQNGITLANHTSVAPALPPLNPGHNARPIISSPILENSTCSAKELLSPLRNAPKVPVRPAPEMPPPNKESKRPLSSPDVAVNGIVPIVATIDEVKKPESKGSAINRIASFLKPADKKPQIDKNRTNSLPRNSSVKANKVLDKEALRTIEISKPILQNDISVANALPVDTEETKAVVMRAQSMRDNNAKPRPAIPTFGSMRQPNGPLKRPLSIPSGARPKSPPPPRPPLAEVIEEKSPSPSGLKIPGIPGYQKPTITSPKDKQNQYDDCLNGAPLVRSEFSSPSSDNIYAVIEETPITSPESQHTKSSNSGSSESVGLLGEIVFEIQNRNLDSIYSTGTMNKKKNNQQGKSGSDGSETYVNTSVGYKSPESVYSNMNNAKSSASSTSSGYIHPSAVNAPVKPLVSKTSEGNSKQNGPSRPTSPVKMNFSTFKNETKKEEPAVKPYTSPFQRAQGPLGSNFTKNNSNSTIPNNTYVNKSETTTENNEKGVKTTLNKPASPTSKTAPKHIRTRKPSPTRPVLPSPKNVPKPNKPITNSPDLVTSCSTNKTTTKPPDVLNNSVKKPVTLTSKPSLNNSVNGVSVNNKTAPKTISKSTSLKSPTDKKPPSDNIKPPVAAKLAKASSDASATGKTISIGAKIVARQNSNVASLQQKFENKPSLKPVTVGKK